MDSNEQDHMFTVAEKFVELELNKLVELLDLETLLVELYKNDPEAWEDAQYRYEEIYGDYDPEEGPTIPFPRD